MSTTIESSWEDERLKKEIESLQQQLADSQKREVMLRDALKSISAIEDKLFGPDWEEIDEARDIATEALAIQPDDSALKAWLGKPVAWTHSCNVLCLDNVELWIDRCPHCGKPAPKGMK